MRARFLLAAAALFAATPALADGLVDNVNGETVDAQGRVSHFTGVLISADGKVTQLLRSGDRRPQRLDWRLDGHGRTLLPGFIDSHGHVMELGFRQLELDLAGTHSLAEAQARITAYGAANADRRWLLGGGWNQEVWGLGRFPTAAELDQVTGDRPTVLARADGHAVWANTAAMRAAGITARTTTPAGGQVLRGAGGVPTGIFVDAAQALVQHAVPEPQPKDRDVAVLRAQEVLLRNGVTATTDMGATVDDWLSYRRTADRGALRMRLVVYGLGVDNAVRIGGTGPTPWLYADRLRLAGVKLYADGALGSRGAWLNAPYADAPRQTGTSLLTDDQIRNQMVRASMDGYQVAVHAIGDRANAQVLGAIEEIADTYHDDRRWRIEHAQVVAPADLPRFGRHGIVASMQPVHQTSDRTMAEARLGPERLAGAYAWATMLRNGATLAFGTDFPVESPDPFAGWAAAFTRQGADGEPFGGWQPQERISREQAWWAYTGAGAYAAFAEHQFGSLSVGQRADFILVDRDPLLASPTDLRQTQVLETWVGGVKVWDRQRDLRGTVSVER